MGKDTLVKPLSLEFVLAAVIALVNFALDQADIHIMLISWLSMLACTALLIDLLRRTDWGRSVGSSSFLSVAALIAICFFLFGAYLSRHQAKEHSPTATEIATETAEELQEKENAKTAVELECNMDNLPLHVSPKGTVHVMLINKKLRSSGLYDLGNNGNKDYIWPSSSQSSANHPNMPPNLGKNIYRCAVSNLGNTRLFDVSLTFSLNYLTPPPSDKQVFPYQVIVNPLSPGEKFTFYVVNECPISASIIQPNQYTAQLLGEKTRHEFQLLRPDRNPAEPIMLALGSSVNWTGEQCN